MIKTVFHVAIGFVLSGCTINQYGPSLVMGDREIVLTQSMDVDNSNRISSAGSSPATTKPVVHQSVRRITTNCTPMPVIHEPPKINLEELKKYKDDPAELEKIFRANHAQLYNGWLKMKKDLDEWKSKPERC